LVYDLLAEFWLENGLRHVADVSRGAAGSKWHPLKLLGNFLQHTRHEKGRKLIGLSRIKCLNKKEEKLGWGTRIRT
jgi:hypothetical protein